MAVSTGRYLGRYLVDTVGKLLSCLARSLPTPSLERQGSWSCFSCPVSKCEYFSCQARVQNDDWMLPHWNANCKLS